MQELAYFTSALVGCDMKTFTTKSELICLNIHQDIKKKEKKNYTSTKF